MQADLELFIDVFIFYDECNKASFVEYESDGSNVCCCFRLSACIPFVLVVNPITRLAFYAQGINRNTTTMNVAIERRIVLMCFLRSNPRNDLHRKYL